jgi:hypothetical protein
MAAAIVLSFTTCGSTGDSPVSSTTDNEPDGTASLSSLLRIAPAENHRWGDHDVTEYSLNPEIRDELMQAVTDAGFQHIWSDTETRDWDLDRSVLRWCVSVDPERWAHELRYCAVGERTLHKYGFKPMSGVNFMIDEASPLGNITLDSLLRIAPSRIETWGEGSDARDMTVYSFNPDIKDTVFQAVTDTSFHNHGQNSGVFVRDWELERGILRWIVPHNPERGGYALQFSALGETAVHFYNFRPIPPVPNSDGVPKIIITTGYSPRGTTTASLELIPEIDSQPIAWAEWAEAVIDGQTITYTLGNGGNLPWTGTGKFYIWFFVMPSPHDPSYRAAGFYYSADGINPTQVDIKDAVTTFEWSKFIWISDWNPG